jgi:pyruvate dehydrogenase E1 component beta subunit
MAELTMVQAINRAFHEEMARDDRVLVYGEDVGVNGGIFRVTEGLIEAFGPQRVFDSPLAESGIVGTAVGLAIYGLRPVIEFQFMGFSYFGFYQIENHVGRYYKRSQGRFPMPIVIRMPYGAGVRALEHHSESRETYYIHTPGIKVVVPSGPRMAHDLLISAIREPDPVVFLEPKALYRTIKEEVPEGSEPAFPIGGSRRVREGGDLTLVAWGAMLPRAREAARRLADEEGISAEVLDLYSLSPMDTDAVIASVKKTRRAVIVHEAMRTLGPGAEIVARLNETCLLHLEAPVVRVTGWDIQVPLFSREQEYLPSVDRILQAAREVLRF